MSKRIYDDSSSSSSSSSSVSSTSGGDSSAGGAGSGVGDRGGSCRNYKYLAQVENNKIMNENGRELDKLAANEKGGDKEGTTIGERSVSPIIDINRDFPDLILPLQKSFISFKSTYLASLKLNEIRKRVQEAVRQHKVFTVRGCYSTVRRALTERGWVEKIDHPKSRARNSSSGHNPAYYLWDEILQHLPQRKPNESRRAHIAKCERSICSRFLEHNNIDLLWSVRREKSDWVEIAKNPALLINRFCKAPFTSKEGLCEALKDFQWFYEEGVSDTYFPRCFNICNPEELSEFIDDFRLTAAMGILKWLVEMCEASGIDAVSDEEGTIPVSAVRFALSRCREYIEFCSHLDIDNDDDPKVWDHDWDVFLTHHYLVTHEKAKLVFADEDVIDNLVAMSASVLAELQLHCPQFHLDGYANIWIIKPGNKCRGRGIQLVNNMKDILAIVSPSMATKNRYVVQKYIERPLIIHNTKFDIRQWFLITSAQPLVIWFYKESYLRFSSQEYSLYNYHESVHLTNHAIQKKYTNGVRDKRLPSENMWDCLTFQAYLRQIGKADLWFDRIYPGMQKAIIGSMLACQDNMDRRGNTFELYGADFMVSEDFYPWLIEINASPDLAPSTSVTARLCPQCVEDTLKVVVDRRNDANADTGEFEMIYRQVIPKTPAYMGLNLALKGQRLTLPKGPSSKEKPLVSPVKSAYMQAPHTASGRLPMPSHSPIIFDLIESLNQKHRKDKENSSLQKRIQSTLVYKKPNFSSVLQQKSPLNIALSGRPQLQQTPMPGQQPTHYSVNRNIRNYLNQLEGDKAKRGAPCAARVCMRSEEFLNGDGSLKKKPLACVGSRFTETDAQKLTYDDYFTKSSSTSSLNRLQQRPAAKDNGVHQKTTSDGSRSSARNGFSNGGGGGGRAEMCKPNSLRKLSRPSSANVCSRKTQSKLAGHAKSGTGSGANPSHFYAVGLSLSAWKSKYKSILKSNLQSQQSLAAVNQKKTKPQASSNARKMQEQFKLLSSRSCTNLSNLNKSAVDNKVQTK